MNKNIKELLEDSEKLDDVRLMLKEIDKIYEKTI